MSILSTQVSVASVSNNDGKVYPVNDIVKLTDTLHLNSIRLSKKSDNFVKVSQQSIHKIFWIDCSYSMSYDLKKIREDLKNKLPRFLNDTDYVSIGWFSGRGEFGLLQKSIKVSSALDFIKVNEAIDRWLTPIGLTGFKEPIQDTVRFIEEFKQDNPDVLFSFFFTSDGYDNQWSRYDNLTACNALKRHISSVTVVEYGWYADHNTLTEMAQALGGEIIFSEEFVNFEPLMQAHLESSSNVSKRVLIKLEVKPKFGLVFSIDDGKLITYTVSETNEVHISENTSQIYYMVNARPLAELGIRSYNRWIASVDVAKNYAAEVEVIKSIYAALSILTFRNEAKEVYNLLSNLGDAYFAKKYMNSFGKQSLIKFQEELLEVTKGNEKPWKEGYSQNILPDDNAFCVLDLFEDLINSDIAKWHPDHKDFVYSRIGSKQVQSQSFFDEDERQKIDDLADAIKNSSDPDEIAKISKDLKELTKGKFKLEFKKNKNSEGYELKNLVWNSERPNLSVLVRYEGTVKLPRNSYSELPKEFETYIFRNYTFIRDGIVNVKYLPVTLPEGLFEKYRTQGILKNNPKKYKSDRVYTIDLTRIPVINQSMVSKVSAGNTFKLEYELLKLKAFEKVFKEFNKRSTTTHYSGFTSKYSQEASDWLATLGITDYKGFSPKTKSEKSGEEYPAVRMKIKIKGASSLPSVKKVEEKVEANKNLNLPESIMNEAIQEINNALNSPMMITSSNKNLMASTWLKDRLSQISLEKRSIQNDLAKIKFAIVLGRVWFEEFQSLENSTMEIALEGRVVKFEALKEDIVVTI